MYHFLNLAYGTNGITADISRDLQYADGLETLTLKYREGADLVVEQVLVEPYSLAELEAANGRVTKNDRKLAWSASTGPLPKLGSVFVDSSGAYWTILGVVYRDQIHTFEAQVRNLSIDATLGDHATVLRATYVKAEGNVALPQWTPILTNIPAHFQPSTEAAQIFLDSEYTKTTYRVIFEKPLPIELAGGEYRLVDGDGHHYRVVEYLDAQRIDTLPVAIAVRIVEGNEYFDGGSDSGSA